MAETPSPQFQIDFLIRFQRLLDEGSFTATYKFALLLALADIAVETNEDTGGAMEIPISLIAEKHIGYYWRHAAPYVHHVDRESFVLKQNTTGQAALVSRVIKARGRYATLSDLKRHHRHYRQLVDRVAARFPEDALWRVQRVDGEVMDFLYESHELHTRVETIELRPGVGFCLRRFHPMLTQMIRGSWLAHVRKVNGAALGTTADLEEFLFGSDRADLSGIRPALVEIQRGDCFYCERSLARTGDVDHFVPWSRYPVDLGHNFVLAHANCNGAKGSKLASEEHLHRWATRNRDHGAAIADACSRASMMHDIRASAQIAAWAYGQVESSGGSLWHAGKLLVPITAQWALALAGL